MPLPNIYNEPSTSHIASSHGERGYPWLFFSMSRSWVTGLIVTLLFIVVGIAFYGWYISSGNDTAPDSLAGLSYALVGTIFLMLAAVSYTLRRRHLRKRRVGQLHAALNWHMFFAILGVIAILMHSFGNFEAISGTYALYGMIALTVSGFIGRALDRIIPRLIAGEVAKVLTVQGEDRVATISQKLEALVVHNTQQEITGFRVDPSSSSTPSGPSGASMSSTLPFDTKGQSLGTSWDLAYISLELTQQELDRDAPHYRLIPDKKSVLTRPGALMPGAQEEMAALQDVHRAMQREQFYRYIIRYWRICHIALALLTIGLVIWHLIYAAQILMPMLFH